MTGVKQFVGDQNSVQFQIGRNPKRITHVKITLDASDTYTVETFKLNNKSLVCTKIESVNYIYNDGLRMAFTSMTGLETSL